MVYSGWLRTRFNPTEINWIRSHSGKYDLRFWSIPIKLCFFVDKVLKYSHDYLIYCEKADILIEKHKQKDGQTDQKTSWQQSRSWDKLPYIHIDKHPITYHQTINLWSFWFLLEAKIEYLMLKHKVYLQLKNFFSQNIFYYKQSFHITWGWIYVINGCIKNFNM